MTLGSRRLCICLLAALVVVGGATPTTDLKFQKAVEAAESAAEMTKEPFGEKNLQAAARFLSSKLRDDIHSGDSKVFFETLDTDSDKSLTLEEMKIVQQHAAELAEQETGQGFYKMMHRLVHENSPKGVHGELFAHLDKDNDGVVTHAEFHGDL